MFNKEIVKAVNQINLEKKEVVSVKYLDGVLNFEAFEVNKIHSFSNSDILVRWTFSKGKKQIIGSEAHYDGNMDLEAWSNFYSEQIKNLIKNI